MTLCGTRLRDVPLTIGWDGVALFLRHLPATSATVLELAPEAVWSVGDYLLADVVDELQAVLYALRAGKGPKPKPVKRPRQKPKYSTAQAVDKIEF